MHPGSKAALHTHDAARAPILRAREADWRVGPVVYQIFVDRFAPSSRLEAKRSAYDAPRRLRSWTDLPEAGARLPAMGLYEHELDFWGGDLASVLPRLDYLQELGVDVLYLNPICDALTNHKYDATDYLQIAPEYGTMEDLRSLSSALHARGMRLMLDGVFNHVGRSSPRFREALADPDSPSRRWFTFDEREPHGYAAWFDVGNLPRLRLEEPEVQRYLYGAPESVVRAYLAAGIDGWRLDVAYDLGFGFLEAITRAAEETKPDAAVIGEIWNYPEEWSPAVHGVMNFHARYIVYSLVDQQISGAHAGALLQRMMDDAGIDMILRSWLLLDNHDTDRLLDWIPETRARRLAQVLMMTLPGAPNLYYGTELGMRGVGDPANRAPMRWDWVSPANEEFVWSKRLADVRRKSPALRVGDYRTLDSQRVLAFSRRTDDIRELRIVVVNPTDSEVDDLVTTRESRLVNRAVLRDLLSDSVVEVRSGLIPLRIGPRTAWVLAPDLPVGPGYSPYLRVV